MGDIAFEALADPPRLRVADTIGNEQYTLLLDSPVEPEHVSTDDFTYPVSDAIRVEVSGFELRGFVRVHLWDSDGELLHVVNQDEGREVPPGEYFVELCRSPKTYIRYSGPLRIESDGERTMIEFGDQSRVAIGARSPRRQPAHTITTTEEPSDVLRALSHLGEGLITTTPSRAFPSLRGHPPEIEIGEELDVPADLASAKGSISMTIPAELEFLYEAAPLIYYLNSDVRSGSRPRMLVDGETVYEFDPDSFSSDVENLLRHVFTLDCVVRRVGTYPVDSVECDRLVEHVPYELPELYHADEGPRLERYLEVPFEPVTQQAPGWPAVGYVEPRAEHVTAIPHLAAQLTPVRTISPERMSGLEARRAALTAFTEGGVTSRGASEVFSGNASFVDVEPSVDTTIWVGSDIPIGSNKFVVQGYQNRYERTASGKNSIDVTIVCNESWMDEEATSVADHYLERPDLPFQVSTHEHLDRASLADVLAEKTDFLHYVGHATPDGLKCSDGYLDIAKVPDIGVETFFLNACQSYRQAKRLVERGSIGGIATLSDVTDDQASVVGRTTAKLLDLGYSLRVALEIACTRSVVGGQYLVVGDDGITLVSSDGPPNSCSITSTASRYELIITTYQSTRTGLGALYVPWLDHVDQGYLVGRSIGPFELTASELREFLEYTNVPVDFEGEFRWAYDLAEELS